MKIHAKNFQSLKDISLPVEGLTVIVGSSNAGKSALIRAASAALCNKSGNYFVRNGAKNAEVTIEGLPNVKGGTLDVSWEKGKKPTTFTINGEAYAKVGKGVPSKLEDAGYRDLSLRDVDLRPLIASQSDPRGLFLLHESGHTLVEALAVASKLDLLADAIELCEADRRSLEVTVRTYLKQLEEARGAQETHEPVFAAWVEVTTPVLARARQLQVDQTTHHVKQSAWARRTRAIEVPGPVVLPALPQTVFPAALAAFKRSRLVVPQPCPVPGIPETRLPALIRVADGLRRGLPSPVALPGLPAGAETFPARLAALRKLLTLRKLTPPGGIPALPDGTRVLSAFTAVHNYQTARSRVEGSASTLQALADAVTDARGALYAFKFAHPICPTCEQPWIKTTG